MLDRTKWRPSLSDFADILSVWVVCVAIGIIRIWVESNFFSVFYTIFFIIIICSRDWEREREKGNSESGKYSVELEPGFFHVDNRYLVPTYLLLYSCVSVSNQRERDQDKEGHGTFATPSGILSRSNQVSCIPIHAYRVYEKLMVQPFRAHVT